MKTNTELKDYSYNEWNEAEFISEKEKLTHDAKWNENLKWIKHSQLCKMEKFCVVSSFWVSGSFFTRSAEKNEETEEKKTIILPPKSNMRYLVNMIRNA